MPTTDSPFDTENYAPPASDSRYLKITAGQTAHVRLMDRPIMGWSQWIHDEQGSTKPERYSWNGGQRPQTHPKNKDNGKIDHFWAVIVWNYTTQRTEIWEITQGSIQEAILEYKNDSDWGSPLTYDLKIKRTGTGKHDTKYSVTASPHTDIPEEAIQHLKDHPIQIQNLFTGDNPFETTASDEEVPF